MKKKIFILLVLFLSAASSVNAIIIRTYGGGPHVDFSIYAGATYGADIEKVGLNWGLKIEAISDTDIYVAMGGTHWFGDSSANLFDLNVHYPIINKPDWSLYLLSGVSYFLSDGEDGAGLNLGGGFEFKVSKFILFIEPKYCFSGIDQFTISSGLRIPL